MNKYILQLEVAGQIGVDAILDHSTKPPTIEKLHYEFDDWLGDDLLEGFHCFLCSERLAQNINENKLTGYKFENCKITKSQLFNDLNENGLELPTFYWFKVTGSERDDFFIIPNSILVVSKLALNSLKKFNLNHCDISQYNNQQ